MTDYSEWISARLTHRQRYVAKREPLLFSLITPLRNTPPDFLSALAESIFNQDFGVPDVFEWVIVDNGSTSEETLKVLATICRSSTVYAVRSAENAGIIAGTRLAAKTARGRYLIPVDHDDYLYPDAIRIAASFVQQHKYPAFLYSDEDKVDGNTFCEPYLKPDWDPVLFAHSCYTSHLGIIDRAIAEMLGLYTDPATEGSPDWDAFFRLMIAGYQPVHIPEVLYSWRKHAQSTSSDINAKPYIHSSQRAVLNRFRSAQPNAEEYSVEYSPLFNGTPDWYFRRHCTNPRPMATVVIGPAESACSTLVDVSETRPTSYSTRFVPYDLPLERFGELVHGIHRAGNLIRLVGHDVTMNHRGWYWEVLALMELFPDTIAVGGPLYNPDGICLTAGIHFGFGSGCGMPDRLRPQHDPGYFVRLWKPHSVSALLAQNLVVDGGFLLDVLGACHHRDTIPIGCLGEYIGSAAMRWDRRIVCSPLLTGCTRLDWAESNIPEHIALFLRANEDLIPDARFYSPHFDLRAGYGFRITDPETRDTHLQGLTCNIRASVQEY